MKTVKQLLSQIKKDYMCIRKYKSVKNCAHDYKESTRHIRFVNGITLHYARKLGLTQQEILNALEEKRDYWSANYYQNANQPKIKGKVKLYNNRSDYLIECPSRKFRCPACNKITTDEQVCNSGKEMSPGKICNWKSFGLFGTLGNGYRFIIKDEFLENPQVWEIFMPIELEK